MEIKKLTTSAMMVALAVVLMMVSKAIPAPWLQGGSITLASMVPIIIVSLMYKSKWGLIAGFVYSLIQIITGFYAPPVRDFLSFTLVILFDYIIAYTVLGTAGFFYGAFKEKKWAVAVSGIITVSLRYICHIISGILIWGVYAPEGQSILWYSLTYNGSYMIPEIIITGIVLALISDFIKSHISR